jgi:crossover junction endodeoxyribonuclease RuvC
VTRILGIDPGSLVTGWGVVEADGPRVTRIASGALHAAGDDFPARLRAIHAGVRAPGRA